MHKDCKGNKVILVGTLRFIGGCSHLKDVVGHFFIPLLYFQFLNGLIPPFRVLGPTFECSKKTDV